MSFPPTKVPAVRHVLVVDDDALLLEVLARLLGRHGYDVSIAENGRVALDFLARHPVDLVLTDIAMPVMDGLAFVQELRRLPRLGQLPVVLMSAQNDARVAASLGVRFVHKPLDFGELLAAIAQPRPAGPR